MFWDAVINGLKVLLHWQTYVVAVMFFIISFLPIIVLMFERNKSDALMTKGGCLAVLIQPFFQALAVFISVCILLPIMFGESKAAWSLPWMLMIDFPVRTLILLIILLVLSVTGALVPFLGRFNSFIAFIMGVAVMVFITMVVHSINPELGIRNVDIIPGFLTSIGIVIVSVITSWIGCLVSAVVVTLLVRNKEGISQLIMITLGSILGFIPIFIYGAWIALQIKGLR